MRWLNSLTDSMDMNLSSSGGQRSRHDAAHGVRHSLAIEPQQQTNGEATIGGI